MKLRNLTPHPISLSSQGDTFLSIPSEGGTLPRVTMETRTVRVDSVGPRPFVVTHTTFGEVENLPAQVGGVGLIVSALIRQALPDRKDLFSPQGLVRDENGNVIGCKSLDVNQ